MKQAKIVRLKPVSDEEQRIVFELERRIVRENNARLEKLEAKKKQA